MVIPNERRATQSGGFLAATRRAGTILPFCGVIFRLFGITTKTPGAFLRVSPEGVKHRDMLNKLHSKCLAEQQTGFQQAIQISVNRPDKELTARV